jgi:hypothetical protein
MPVQSIECQLVRAQIGRYLGGEPLSQEAMRQLEIHLVACDDCRAALASRKSDLRAKMSLEGSEPRPRAKADADTIGHKAAVNYKSIEAASNSAPAVKPQKTLKPNSFTKPLVLTAALAVVLVTMSRLSGGNGLSMGPNALSFLSGSTTAQAATPPEKTTAAGPSDKAAPTVTPSSPAAGTGAQPTAASVGAAVNPGPAPTTTSATPASSPTIPLSNASAPAPSSSAPSGAASTTAAVEKPSTPTTGSKTPDNKTPDAKKPAPEAAKPAMTDKSVVTAKPARIEPATRHATVIQRRAKLRRTAHSRAAIRRAHKPHKAARHRPIARIRVYNVSGSPIQ